MHDGNRARAKSITWGEATDMTTGNTATHEALGTRAPIDPAWVAEHVKGVLEKRAEQPPVDRAWFAQWFVRGFAAGFDKCDSREVDPWPTASAAHDPACDFDGADAWDAGFIAGARAVGVSSGFVEITWPDSPHEAYAAGLADRLREARGLHALYPISGEHQDDWMAGYRHGGPSRCSAARPSVAKARERSTAA
jgi:hypothetical protein